jgi:hypothetical protein
MLRAMPRMTSPLAFAVGALGWTAAEYALHRLVGHGPRRRRPARWYQRISPSGLLAEFNEEHLAHHADPTYFAPTSRKAVAAVVSTTLVGAALSALVGPRRGCSFAVGFGAMYVTYEVLHRVIHTHPPTGPYSRWARQHHLLHHFRAPRLNHGVTTPIWDHVFNTVAPVSAPLRVPSKLAPVWMIDPATGAVRAPYGDDYNVV